MIVIEGIYNKCWYIIFDTIWYDNANDENKKWLSYDYYNYDFLDVTFMKIISK